MFTHVEKYFARSIDSTYVVVFQKGEAQVVSGEVETILKTSRFASKFTLTATDRQPIYDEVRRDRIGLDF